MNESHCTNWNQNVPKFIQHSSFSQNKKLSSKKNFNYKFDSNIENQEKSMNRPNR